MLLIITLRSIRSPVVSLLLSVFHLDQKQTKAPALSSMGITYLTMVVEDNEI